LEAIATKDGPDYQLEKGGEWLSFKTGKPVYKFHGNFNLTGNIILNVNDIHKRLTTL
jgi:hypothetical protein